MAWLGMVKAAPDSGKMVVQASDFLRRLVLPSNSVIYAVSPCFVVRGVRECAWCVTQASSTGSLLRSCCGVKYELQYSAVYSCTQYIRVRSGIPRDRAVARSL